MAACSSCGHHHVGTRCPTARETACRSNPILVVIGLSRGGQFCGLLQGWLDCIKLNDNLHGYTHEHMYHEDHVNTHTVTEWHTQLSCKMQPTKALASMIEEQLNFILCQHSKSQTKGMHRCIEQGGRREGERAEGRVSSLGNSLCLRQGVPGC